MKGGRWKAESGFYPEFRNPNSEFKNDYKYCEWKRGNG